MSVFPGTILEPCICWCIGKLAGESLLQHKTKTPALITPGFVVSGQVWIIEVVSYPHAIDGLLDEDVYQLRVLGAV